MKKYFSLNRIIGLASLLVFVLFVTFGSSLSLANGILFFVLGMIMSVAAFVVINMNIPLGWDSCWLTLPPFIAIMALCDIVLGWDVYLPFLFCGIFSVALSSSVKLIAFENSKTKAEKGSLPSISSLIPVFRIFGTAAVTTLLFVCICGFVEVFI